MKTKNHSQLHTPGPWRAERVDYPAGKDVSFEILPFNGNLICQTFMREIGDEDEQIALDEANARLIASAPDLLAALKDCMANLPQFPGECAYSRARAAIAKAEGDL